MKPAIKPTIPAPVPTSGGSYTLDPATGVLVRNPPPVAPEPKPKEAL